LSIKNKSLAKEKIREATSKIYTNNNSKSFVAAYILSCLEKVSREDIETMAVGPINQNQIALYYNVEFVNSIKLDELIGVLIHEAMHIILQHLKLLDTKLIKFRGEYSKQHIHTCFNVAADLYVNQAIIEDGNILPNGCISINDFPFKKMQSVDYYFEQLLPIMQKFNIDEAFVNHSMWRSCQDSLEQVDRILSRAEGLAKISSGHFSEQGDSDIHIEEKVPKEDWKKHLRIFCKNNKMEYDYKFNRFDRRRTNFNGNESFPCKIKKQKMPKVLFFIDISGSIDSETISKFIAEAKKARKYSDVTCLFFDVRIISEFTDLDKIKKIQGGGGTSFQCIFDRVAKEKDRNVVILTDGYADLDLKIPNKTRILWALTEEHRNFDALGKKILIKE